MQKKNRNTNNLESLGSLVEKNREAGIAREKAAFDKAVVNNPGKVVYVDRYLLDSEGRRLIDPSTQTARRVDIVVVELGPADDAVSYPPDAYDKAKWHSDGDFPSGISSVQPFVHTGLYLGWIIERELYSEEFADDNADEIPLFLSRAITGTRVYEICDGVFTPDMLSEEGYAFTDSYFDFESDGYFKDYERLLASDLLSIYYVQDTWVNYDKIKACIDRRYSDWKASQ
jgi:hypothetical protein